VHFNQTISEYLEHESCFANFCSQISLAVRLDVTLDGSLTNVTQLGLALVLGLSAAEHGAHNDEAHESKEEEDEENNEKGLGSRGSHLISVGLGINGVDNDDGVLAVELLRVTVVTRPGLEELALLLLHLVLDRLENTGGDGVDLSSNIEESDLSARRRREGTLIGPAVVEVDLLEHVTNNGAHIEVLILVNINPLVEESVGGGQDISNICVEVRSIEDHGEGGTEGSLVLLRGDISRRKMDHVHLKVENLAVDSMFGRMMNVELERVPHSGEALGGTVLRGESHSRVSGKTTTSDLNSVSINLKSMLLIETISSES
jgi:hypothetical protein